MNRIACQYAIVRFAPFVETGEFANVGVVLLAADQAFLGFELETRRSKRITDFFDDVDSRLYLQSVKELNAELKRLQRLVAADAGNYGDSAAIFEELIRPRESIIRFSEPRVVLADNPERKLAALHQYYVHRSFHTPEQREAKLARGIGNWLKDVGIRGRFTQARLGNDDFETPELPFVEQRDGKALKAMKPLNLGQTTPSAILEHANRWQFRLAEIRRRNLFSGQFLFAVDGPGNNKKLVKAFDEARDWLASAQATVVNYKERDAVLEFAMKD
ncbi:MAG: DUF3037 domain-containing protein [Salinisphaera sp.]|uniref:DUF3037 domain-containing protein n=1 Tax=Salinisphaera sp. TaxID=1914330 RepID=UPI003C7E644F